MKKKVARFIASHSSEDNLQELSSFKSSKKGFSHKDRNDLEDELNYVKDKYYPQDDESLIPDDEIHENDREKKKKYQFGSKKSDREKEEEMEMLKEKFSAGEDVDSKEIEKLLEINKGKFRKKNAKDYELVEVIGKGAYARVYRAVHKKNGKTFAVKILKVFSARKGGGNEFTAIRKEIEILQKCDSQYVVKYHDAFVFEGKLFIVLELCEGSLSELMSVRGRPFTEKEVSVIARGLLKCTNYLHSKHIVHRDIKAGNVLLTKKGKVKLVDFGISTVIRSTMSRRKTFAGSPYWMAPEVILSSGSQLSYDKSVDIWSIGITLIELAQQHAPLHGVHPFRAIFLIPNNPSPELKDKKKFSSTFHHFIADCLEKDPRKRATVKELLAHKFIKMHKKESSKFLCKYVEEVNQIYRNAGGKLAYYDKLGDKAKSFTNDDEEDDINLDEDTDDEDEAEADETLVVRKEKRSFSSASVQDDEVKNAILKTVPKKSKAPKRPWRGRFMKKKKAIIKAEKPLSLQKRDIVESSLVRGDQESPVASPIETKPIQNYQKHIDHNRERSSSFSKINELKIGKKKKRNIESNIKEKMKKYQNS